MQYNKNATWGAKEDIKAALKTLNDHLLTRTYLVGECVTLADIAVACTLLSLYKQVLGSQLQKTFHECYTLVHHRRQSAQSQGCSRSSRSLLQNGRKEERAREEERKERRTCR